MWGQNILRLKDRWYWSGNIKPEACFFDFLPIQISLLLAHSGLFCIQLVPFEINQKSVQTLFNSDIDQTSNETWMVGKNFWPTVNILLELQYPIWAERRRRKAWCLKTPKCSHPNCIKAPRSHLGPPPVGRPGPSKEKNYWNTQAAFGWKMVIF